LSDQPETPSTPNPPASPAPPGSAKPALSEAQTFWLAAAFLLLVLGYMTIAGCARGPLSAYDDRVHIAWNPLLQEGRGTAELFTRPHYAQYIPVTLLSYKLNYALFGRDALASFRVVNWLLHAASGLLLLALLMRLGLSRLEALFLAAVWTTHPLACESVAWVSQRSNCLAVFFGFAGLLAYVEWHRKWPGLVGGVLGFLLALLSKPAALGFLPLFVAVEVLGGPARLRGEGGENSGTDKTSFLSPNFPAFPVRGWLGAALRLAPLAALAAVFAVVGAERARVALMPPPGGHWYTALLTDLEILPRYLFNIFLPVRLSAFYGVADIESLADGRVYLFGAVLAALVGATLWAARSRRRALFGWLWFFGALGPSLNLVAITFLMQDRYVYYASAGALLVALEVLAGVASRVLPSVAPAPSAVRRSSAGGGACATSAEKADTGLNRPLVYVAGVCVVLLAFAAAARSVLWDGRNLPLLFADAVEKQPESGLARTFYGLVLAEAAGRARAPGPARDPQAAFASGQEALAQFKAAQTKPDFYRYFDPLLVRVVLAREAIRLGQRNEAREALAEGFPPPAPPNSPETGLGPQELGLGFRAAGPGRHGATYLYRLPTVAQGYVVLAEANLQEFSDPVTPEDRAWKLIESARERLAAALALDANCTEVYFRQALISVLEPPKGEPDVAGKATEQLKEARERFRDAAPALEDFLYREMQFAFRPPVPPSRPAALGRLALSQTELLRAQEKPAKEGLALGRRALADAEDALKLDPTFGEAYWVQARVHLLLDELCEKLKDSGGSWEHFNKARGLLLQVPKTSPYFPLAQGTLRTLRPPPPPPAPRPGETKAESPPAPGNSGTDQTSGLSPNFPAPTAEGETRKAEDRRP